MLLLVILVVFVNFALVAFTSWWLSWFGLYSLGLDFVVRLIGLYGSVLADFVLFCLLLV